MDKGWSLSPAHMTVPGSGVNQNGAVFSTVFRDCQQCGLILYHLTDLSEHVIRFTDEYRYGSLYSVRIEGIDPKEWAYRYYRDDYSFEDPYARELIELKTKSGKVIAGRLFPANEDELPAYGSRNVGAWADQFIYVCHVKGFTASRTSKAAHRGTFRGVIEKIPYLQKLGVTAVEFLPIYELRPEALGRINGLPEILLEEKKEATSTQHKPEYTRPLQRHENSSASSQGNAAEQSGSPDHSHSPAAAESGEGSSQQDQKTEKVNYWNFGEGCYFAPRHAYAASDTPQLEFKDMVDALHKSGIRVYLQLFFPETVSIQTQQETARFYVTHYHIDGFHLKGQDSALKTLASDPMLSDTALFYYNFPYEDLQKEDKENPTVGRPSIHHLAEYRDDFEPLVRKFVKSDNFVLREFVKRFVFVPEDHGAVHYVCNYDGFTLMDLVSYNWKRNWDNGENNADGTDENNSWNCGLDGKTMKRDVRTLRIRQIKNFLTLNFLAQGTPVLHAGDERCNSQNGNNNPYCQDNEVGWMTWTDTVDSHEILKFTQAITAFRRDHGIFRRRHPFTFNDYQQLGYPDISFHGKDAYKPDFSGYCHTVGIMYNEAYDDTCAGKEQQRDRSISAGSGQSSQLLYLAINMHWHNQLLGIPQPPKGCHWYLVMDTFRDKSFMDRPLLIPDQRHTAVPGRSIQVLEALPEIVEPVQCTVGCVKAKH